MFQVGDEVLVVDDSPASVGTTLPFKVGDKVLVEEIGTGSNNNISLIKVGHIWWLSSRFVLNPGTLPKEREWWNHDEEAQ